MKVSLVTVLGATATDKKYALLRSGGQRRPIENEPRYGLEGNGDRMKVSPVTVWGATATDSK